MILTKLACLIAHDWEYLGLFCEVGENRVEVQVELAGPGTYGKYRCRRCERTEVAEVFGIDKLETEGGST